VPVDNLWVAAPCSSTKGTMVLGCCSLCRRQYGTSCRNSEALNLSPEKSFISQGNITGKLVQIKNAKDSISQGSITHGMPNSKKEYYSLEIGEPYPLLLEMPV